MVHAFDAAEAHLKDENVKKEKEEIVNSGLKGFEFALSAMS